MADSPATMTDRVPASGRATSSSARTGRCWPRAAGAGPGRPRLELDFLGWPRYSDGTSAARLRLRRRRRARLRPAGARDAPRRARRPHPRARGAGGRRRPMAPVLVLLPVQRQGVPRHRPARGRLGDGPGQARGRRRPARDGLRPAQSRRSAAAGGSSRSAASGRSSTWPAGRRPRSRRPAATTRPWCPTTPTARARRWPTRRSTWWIRACRSGSTGPGAGARPRRATGSSRTARAVRPIRTSGPTRRRSTRSATRSAATVRRSRRSRPARRRKSAPAARATAR